VPDEVDVRRRDEMFVTFREAVEMFATKADITALHTSIASLTAQIGALVPRAEHELHWRVEDEKAKSVSDKVDALMAARVPTWLLALVGPILAALVAHFWK
jgi:hypothetical protein